MRAGAASESIAPPLGLPMLGFVRAQEGATEHGLPLEATALVLEEAETRVVLCGVDTLGLPAEECDRLRARIAAETGAEAAGILLNWNHTHRAPPGSRALLRRSGLLAGDGDERIDAYAELVAARVAAAARRAAERLEPAALAWGAGEVDVSVNRRERGPTGQIVHGWREDGLLDRQVVALQARRRDGSAVATLVGFGCHTVAVGMDFPGYSSDFGGALRASVRAWSGGECVFFQGAAGNVLPRCSFCEDEREAERMGARIALEALHALADRPDRPRRLVRRWDGSLIPMSLFRWEDGAEEPTPLAAAERRLAFPLLAAPSPEELRATAEEHEASAAEATSDAERYGHLYHAKWARRTLEAGPPPAAVEAPVHAVRLGDGLIVTAPGEAFTEIGLAVKERAPGRPTLFAGYTNGAVGYFPTAAAYAEGGYEPAYSNRSYGEPAPVAPECERLLVETGVRLAESLFPERPRWQGGWEPSGLVPALPAVRVERPPQTADPVPATARAPG